MTIETGKTRLHLFILVISNIIQIRIFNLSDKANNDKNVILKT